MAPVVFAVSAIAGSIAAAAPAIGAFLTTNFVGRMLASVAVSALISALSPNPTNQAHGGGIRTTVTQTGGNNPCSCILGRSATAGTHLCPPMSHGVSGDTPNAYLTYVIELGDIPGQTLEQVIINGEYVTLGGVAHADYGYPVQGDYAGYAWVKYLDGSQTTADTMLMAKYGSYPERPWASDMIGRGLSIAICTFLINRELMTGFPTVRFVMGGIPLYNPRKDTTVGGSGAHRWNNQATWEPSRNPFVQIYNIMRGIAEPGGSVWGGRIAAADIPLSSWFAAMNACDQGVSLSGGGTEPAYETGIEVTFDQKPADVIRAIMAGASGQVAEVGGLWKAQAGAPAMPVYFFTDDDVIISKNQSLAPFPTSEITYNGVHAAYPEPKSLWDSKDADPVYNATYEAQDQVGRRVADLRLPAVWNARQVRRLQFAYLKEGRRFRRHALTLPPDAAILEPLDTASWTSTANGYVTKDFELSQVEDDLATVLQRCSLRERDPSDYSWSSSDELPLPANGTAGVRPAAQAVPGWDVQGVAIKDAAGVNRRPAIRVLWTGDLPDVTGVNFEVRVQATGVVVAQGTAANVSPYRFDITSGILPGVVYEARGRLVTGRKTSWTAWIADTAPDLKTNTDDITDNAVTSKGQVKNNKSFTITSDAAWTDCAEISLIRTAGYMTDFTISLSLSGYATGVLQCALFRGATQVDSRPHTTADKGSATQMSFSGIDQDKSGGKVTYKVRCKKAAGTYFTGNLIVTNIYLKVTQFKK